MAASTSALLTLKFFTSCGRIFALKSQRAASRGTRLRRERLTRRPRILSPSHDCGRAKNVSAFGFRKRIPFNDVAEIEIRHLSYSIIFSIGRTRIELAPSALSPSIVSQKRHRGSPCGARHDRLIRQAEEWSDVQHPAAACNFHVSLPLGMKHDVLHSRARATPCMRTSSRSAKGGLLFIVKKARPLGNETGFGAVHDFHFLPVTVGLELLPLRRDLVVFGKINSRSYFNRTRQQTGLEGEAAFIKAALRSAWIARNRGCGGR